MELTRDQRAELQAVVKSADVPAPVATRARVVLWRAEGRLKKQIAELAGVSRPTVDLWLDRYEAEGFAGLVDRSHAAPREQVPAPIRARILAATRMSPPAGTGLSQWSSREMAAFIKRTEGVYVSHHFVAKLWRENGVKPHRAGTFKVSKDPAFAEKVADIVGLYLDPPGGAVVLSMDEKTQIQALDRTQPMLPMAFDATEKRTHDYVRHGTTNLFAALNVGTGEVFGECKPTRDGDDFLAFLEESGETSCWQGHPSGVRQPVHSHHPSRTGLVGEESAHPLSLHPGRLVLAQPDRNLVWHHHPPVHPSGHFQQCQSPDQADTRLYQALEHQRQTVRLDRHHRRDPSQGPPRRGQYQETRRQ